MNIKKLTMLLATFTFIPLLATANEEPVKPDFKTQISDILNRKEVLLINNENEYIYNLNTTQFIKGLFVQSSYLFKYIADNSEDTEKLVIAVEDLAFNTMCLQASLGQEALPHLNIVNKLSLPTEELKAKYQKGMEWITTKNEIPKLSPEMLKMCKDQGLKALEYQKENKKAN